MSEPIIEIKGLGKRYSITRQQGRYVSLRDVLMNVVKSPFAILKTKAKRAVGLEKKEEYWALKGIDFTVEKGEVIGIIGKNGAGKSTLLKILSQITPPTEGEAIIRGRVGSLLEVGTGFHPELTGRENIFLNGAILGMTKREIARKFDDIVSFAGVDKFIDTPVKYFSSGMYVRLAFSVAAHMEPDILIVDEVLAVGDIEFQKKCLGKMGEITKKDGRTILFVSHNMAAIGSLCKKTILLEDGKIVKSGDTEEVIASYQERFSNKSMLKDSVSVENGKTVFSGFSLNRQSNQRVSVLKSGEKLAVAFSLQSGLPRRPMNVGYSIKSIRNNQLVIFTHANLEKADLHAEDGSTIVAEFDMPRLSPGEYSIDLHAWIDDQQVIPEVTIGTFSIAETVAFKGRQSFNTYPSIIMADTEWRVDKK